MFGVEEDAVLLVLLRFSEFLIISTLGTLGIVHFLVWPRLATMTT
jgi:hypothetical protein